MRFPLALTVKIARHIIKHKILRTPRFALVLQLEPLHTCNLTCTGCGRIREYSTSLKDKRAVVRGVKDRIWSKFRASIAEIDEQGSLRRAVLGLAFVSNDKQLLDSLMNKIIDLIENCFPGLLEDFQHDVEIY